MAKNMVKSFQQKCQWLYERLKLVYDWPRALVTRERGLLLLREKCSAGSNRDNSAEGPRSRRLCVFSHYDQGNLVSDSVWIYLEQLRAVGCDIVFVSTSPLHLHQNKPQWRRLLKTCDEVIVRKNVGYDFGSWKFGLKGREAELEKYDEVILANDSVYGPFLPLSIYFSAMEESNDYDVWSFTESFENRYHLQSYFLVFRLRRSDKVVKLLLQFFQSYPYLSQRRAVVRMGELRLSRWLQRYGLRVGAVCPVDEIAGHILKKHNHGKEKRQNLNPTLYYWDVLIDDYKFPFIKRELLRAPPDGVPDTRLWHEHLPEQSLVTPGMIMDHLQQSTAARK